MIGQWVLKIEEVRKRGTSISTWCTEVKESVKHYVLYCLLLPRYDFVSGTVSGAGLGNCRAYVTESYDVRVILPIMKAQNCSVYFYMLCFRRVFYPFPFPASIECNNSSI